MTIIPLIILMVALYFHFKTLFDGTIDNTDPVMRTRYFLVTFLLFSYAAVKSLLIVFEAY